MQDYDSTVDSMLGKQPTWKYSKNASRDDIITWMISRAHLPVFTRNTIEVRISVVSDEVHVPSGSDSGDTASSNSVFQIHKHNRDHETRQHSTEQRRIMYRKDARRPIVVHQTSLPPHSPLCSGRSRSYASTY